MAIGVQGLGKRFGGTVRRVRWDVLATWLAATVASAGFWTQVVLLASGPQRREATLIVSQDDGASAPRKARVSQTDTVYSANSGGPYAQ
jgi:hypothetical protein